MNIPVQVNVQFALNDSSNEKECFNIHFKNQLGFTWEVVHDSFQLARLDHYLNSRTDELKKVYYPVITRGIVKKLRSPNKSQNSKITSVASLEVCRKLLELWVIAVVEIIGTLDIEASTLCEQFFGLPMGPSSKSPKFQFSLFDNGLENNDEAWELMSLYSETTTTNLTNSTHITADTEWTRMRRRSKANGGSESNGQRGSITIDMDNYLLKVRVERGMAERGVLEYNIILKTEENPGKLLKVRRRYDLFRKLNESLQSHGVVQIVPFPPRQAKMTMDERSLSKRARLLDLWMREVCTIYNSLNEDAKFDIQIFLGFDMTNPKHCYLLDKLNYSLVEAIRAPVLGTPSNINDYKLFKISESDEQRPTSLTLSDTAIVIENTKGAEDRLRDRIISREIALKKVYDSNNNNNNNKSFMGKIFGKNKDKNTPRDYKGMTRKYQVVKHVEHLDQKSLSTNMNDTNGEVINILLKNEQIPALNTNSTINTSTLSRKFISHEEHKTHTHSSDLSSVTMPRTKCCQGCIIS